MTYGHKQIVGSFRTEELDATAIKEVFERQFDRIATLQRNYSDAAAAVALWNKRNKTKQIDNPFADLREELPIKDSKKEERRVWHPSGRDDPGDHRSPGSHLRSRRPMGARLMTEGHTVRS